MSIRVALHHRTAYRFDREVALGPHVVRLRPASHSHTRITSYSFAVEPREHFLNWQQDPQGNHIARLVFPRRARELVFTVDLVAELVAVNAFDFFLEPGCETLPFAYESWLATELAAYLVLPPSGPRVESWVESWRDRVVTAGEPLRTIDFLVALNREIASAVRYLIRLEPGVQPPEETLALGSGSCRDSAWLLVAVLRGLGLAARFCSGYLVQLRPDRQPHQAPDGPAADFTDLHAWTEVYLPGAGWVGLDPTSGLLTAEGHIPLACTPDPGSAAPVSGLVDPCETSFDVTMRVDRLAEKPRTTDPFSDEAWDRIDALGRRVDAALAEGDVRLTAGGEPTYVSLDDFESPQWNTDADGPEKRRQAGALARRLLDSLAPGGVLIEGQGKQYPGEPLPRWALEVLWHADGEPIWKRRDLLAADEPGDEEADEPAGPPPAAAHQLLLRLAEGLRIDPQLVMPAREDPRRLASLALGEPVAWVLPLLRQDLAGERRWRSSRWPLAEIAVGTAFENDPPLLLVPGDSAAGYRLPMADLPWPDRRELLAGTSIVRTSVVAEIRGGRLHLFLPPLEEADDWLELLAEVEQAAAAVATPLVLEGYPPPSDARLVRLQVTPDPGVIEVNVPPSASWEGLVALRETVDREARACRLGGEKFEIDGRHIGTGGGDHVVLGGPTAAESPFLRRPDLLASLVAYWNNHPSLSYLFAGLFIGPTSQAPRVDEGRHESLYELEIALEQLERAGPRTPPWFVDRVFRHLLTDMTGNTHRAEFCIDKLYAPEGEGGRRGLVELRGFEMAPHVRMGLVTQLLIRALVACFWREPYRGRLVRWGTDLHDRFLLPWFLMKDFDEVLATLARRGFSFDPRWFQPQREFRFPRLGEVSIEGVRIELRLALEPWNVLGEQPAGGATSRMVDSSLERLQVLVSGLPGLSGSNDSRYAVTCNRRRLPLAATGVVGQSVAGVRFRAWQPPECLHPTIRVHTPLVFDLVDLWNRRSVGGCTWHVAHPGGRSYETRPVNALESESRRASRFFASGHTPGSLEIPPLEHNPQFPHTLDLRRG